MSQIRQFAVIGLGRFGTSLASTLEKLGHEVLALDKDESKVQKYSDSFTHVIQGDSTDESVLKAIGIRNFDCVIIAIGGDLQDNVMTTLLVKELGIKYVVAKAQNHLHGRMLEKIGADRVVYPEREMGQRVAHSLVSTTILDFIELSPEISILEITAPAKVINKTLLEANLRAKYRINVLAIKRNNKIIATPMANDMILEKDILIVMGDNKDIHELENQ
ncbi:Ktr system potassium uptake protein C [Propionispora sp. 2/2-37]|uniref:potassium channel family protein n=1 Tax=Propionispora sp. 2/2-37 TaxID=1677858 RepID=UPI0006BB9268|nr:TrkA family potassium uptake protein [Propionispora sp. 2/2-37]CUH95522.1 Ktr system potassium uptake protein C [Propionispora sp. 2/2-37]